MDTTIPIADAAALAALPSGHGYQELVRYFQTLEEQMAMALETSADPNALANWRGARFALAMLKIAPAEAQQVLENTYPEPL